MPYCPFGIVAFVLLTVQDVGSLCHMALLMVGSAHLQCAYGDHPSLCLEIVCFLHTVPLLLGLCGF
jgi:hypothetical protein